MPFHQGFSPTVTYSRSAVTFFRPSPRMPRSPSGGVEATDSITLVDDAAGEAGTHAGQPRDLLYGGLIDVERPRAAERCVPAARETLELAEPPRRAQETSGPRLEGAAREESAEADPHGRSVPIARRRQGSPLAIRGHQGRREESPRGGQGA